MFFIPIAIFFKSILLFTHKNKVLIMKKKLYQKPTMNVVKLQHQAHLLQASGEVKATMSGTFTETDDWDEE